MSQSQSVMDSDFEKEVLQSDLPVVVDFWAPWCGPCKAMGPIIDEVSGEYAGKARFVKMNVDENNDVPGRFGVMSIPTFIVFKGGQAARSFVGSKPKEDFKREVDTALAA